MNKTELQYCIDRITLKRDEIERQCAANWSEWSKLAEPGNVHGADADANAAKRDELHALILMQQRQIEFFNSDLPLEAYKLLALRGCDLDDHDAVDEMLYIASTHYVLKEAGTMSDADVKRGNAFIASAIAYSQIEKNWPY